MITGCLVGDSLRAGSVFEPRHLRIRRITRLNLSAGAVSGQPQIWTVIDFEAEDHDGHDVDGLAEELAACLSAEGGWYADFATDDERVVVFAGKVFRFPRGDEAGRAEAVAYGRSVGVPDHQLDWRD
ncbi:hypothetical protein [Actinacidiphila soli]|uniref:hypothetical protein n=1 Tax=Actinacidiphila soli TaxID=2487275 RepID=UPI000FC9DF56|nr:hypothetical protein [Actinacidiphila soli]